MIDEDPRGCLAFWMPWPPRGSVGQWLLALGTVIVLLAVFTAIFSALGL